MAGFVYACHTASDTMHVKIGFTTQPDPNQYCRNNFGRTFCPLNVLVIAPFAHARAAETVVHTVLAPDRLDSHHEMFDLSYIRHKMTGEQRLQQALDMAAAVDGASGGAPPIAVDAQAARQEKRARKAQQAQQARASAAAARQAKERGKERAAEDERKQRASRKASRIARVGAARRAARQAAAAEIERWAAERLEFGETDEYRVRKSAWYADYKAWARSSGQRLLGPKQAAVALKQLFPAVYTFTSSSTVYGGVRLAPRP